MKYLVALLFVVFPIVSSSMDCTYGQPGTCEADQYCTKVSKTKAICKKNITKLPSISYPFHSLRYILCDQGTNSPEGNSHTFSKTLFAIDLKTPPLADAASIFAGSEGLVVVRSSCVEHNTNCGYGFGNVVQILRFDGVLIQYAHLDKTYVKTGEWVKQGQIIGVEGNTGLTGGDNRHLHLSVHSDWRPIGLKDMELKGYLPDSIPFLMNICQGQYNSCNGQLMDARQLRCRRITDMREPVLHQDLNL